MNIKNIKKIGFLTCWLPLLVGVITTLAVAWFVDYKNNYEVNLYTNSLADKTESLIDQRFQHFEYGLRGARGAIATVGVDEITRKQFEKYSGSRNLESEFPGALGFGFIRRVSVEQESDFLTHARTDDAPNFTIRALTPHDSDRFVIQYIYPEEKNRQAIGLDIGSETNRRTAALSAARYDKPYLTAPITLVQANKKPRKGALVLLPIYSDEIPLNTPEEREAAVVGWSYAPLVIDEVLANLESLTNQATVSLTNLTETEPFYRSSVSEESNSIENGTTRTVFILGQHWKMELVPSTQAVNNIKTFNVGLVIALGLGLTFLTLFIINLLQTNPTTVDPRNEIYQLNFKSISVYFKSSQFKRSCPFGLLILFLIFLVSVWLIAQSHFSEVVSNLSGTKQSTMSILEEEVSQYRRDTLFIANSPLISELKSHNEDVNKPVVTSALLQQSNKRLEDIFKAYMLSNTDVYQLRFIEAANGWQERVKVQRNGEELVAFDKESLQSKKNEPYIIQTFDVGPGNVFQSDINLNREFGKIEQPMRPVWRFSTPLLYSDGRPLGMIIINVNADSFLQKIANSATPNTKLYVTNNEGDFLLHPNPSKSFTFEYGSSNRWQDEFHPVHLSYGFNRFNFTAFSGQQGNVFANESNFPLSSDSNDRAIKIYVTISQFFVFEDMAIEIGSVLVLLLFISLIGFIIQYWVWLNEKIRQRDTWNTQIELQRHKEMTRFKGLLESAPDATFVINELGVILVVNAQAGYMFGYDRHELEGEKILKLLPEYSRQVSESRLIERMKGDDQALVQESNNESIAQKSNGDEFPIETSLSAVNLDDEILVSASVRNISERFKSEEKLRNALRDAEIATQAKSVFLANTSHEIRTPLNAIIGLSYLLAEEKLTESQHQLVSKIQISGKSLLGVVNDVLDLSKIEANEMELEAQPVELRELCEEVSSVFAIQAEAKNLEFHFELDPKLPAWVMTDSIRLRQILANLISNSLKFTTIGKISISAKVADTKQVLPENHINVRFMVTDTGIGISPEAQALLFKPFSQADTSTTRRFGGTGLGLSIVHQLVSLMEGKIGIESTENVGSQFWVELPLRVQTIEEIAAQENQNQTIFVLIAEDDPADAQQLRKMTRALGWRSEVVSNGVELVDAYIARQENNLRPPDAMILDWQMPLMDGIEAMNLLASKIGRENLPAVLMVSAHDKEVITTNDPEHYASGFLLKPVDPSSLFNAVNDAVTLNTGNSKRVLQSTRSEAVGAKWLPNMRLLVVDDSPTNLIVVSHVLKHNGALVQTANSGEEALILLEDSSNDYDAVLMDVQMPGIDGLETTARVRKDLGLTSLPIIALTAGALVEEKNRALDAGMNDFLTKPIDPSKLINVLRTLVEAYRGKEIAIESLRSTVSETLPETEEWPTITGLNLDKAKNILLGDKELFLNTLGGLLSDYSNLALEPDDEIDGPDAEPLRLETASQVHKLRSVSGMVGAKKIQQLAAQAEKTLRSEHEPAKQVLVELSLALQGLQQASWSVLDVWKKEKFDALSSKGEAPELQPETVTHILMLLEEQDLSALEEFDEHSESFRAVLGHELFEKLKEYLAKLNYKEAISILTPLKKP